MGLAAMSLDTNASPGATAFASRRVLLRSDPLQQAEGIFQARRGLKTPPRYSSSAVHQEPLGTHGPPHDAFGQNGRDLIVRHWAAPSISASVESPGAGISLSTRRRRIASASSAVVIRSRSSLVDIER